MHRVISAPLMLATTAACMLASAAPAMAHDVTTSAADIDCDITVNRPYASTKKSVRFTGSVTCNQMPDASTTYAILEIHRNGSWGDYGNPVTNDSIAPTVTIADGAPKYGSSCYYYRGQINRVVWANGKWKTFTKHGAQRTICPSDG